MPKHSGNNIEDQVFESSSHDEDNRFDGYDEIDFFPSRSKHRKPRFSTRERVRSKSRKNQRTAFTNFSATSDAQVHMSRKKNARIEEREAQLQARKRNIQARKCKIQARTLCAQTQSFSYEEDSYGFSYEEDSYGYYNFEVLPATELGIEEGSMYERLLNILEGEDITPEDYDLLLQLDSTNFRPTLEAEDIDKFPEMVFGSEKIEDLRSQQIVGSFCEICLEEWSTDTCVRLLPCKHVFCKECIDHWFREISTKCPNLGCFWCKDST